VLLSSNLKKEAISKNRPPPFCFCSKILVEAVTFFILTFPAIHGIIQKKSNHGLPSLIANPLKSGGAKLKGLRQKHC